MIVAGAYCPAAKRDVTFRTPSRPDPLALCDAMAVVYACPVCGHEHRSRLMALRRRYFDEVIPQLGEIVELCPETGQWVALTFDDMTWLDVPRTGVGWM